MKKEFTEKPVMTPTIEAMSGPVVDAPAAEREAIARICAMGHVAPRSHQHGGGFTIIWEGKDYQTIFHDRDHAGETLARLRTDAILTLIGGRE